MAADATYPVETIAELLDLTPRRVYRLTTEGIIPKARAVAMSWCCGQGIHQVSEGPSDQCGCQRW